MPTRTASVNPSTPLRSRVAALLATLLIGGALSFTPAGAPATTNAATAPTSEAVSGISMDAGGSATCTIRTDRTLWCWGSMWSASLMFFIDGGKIGENGKNEPQQIGSSLWLNVSVGTNNVCGIVIPTKTSTSGALYCFGSNQYGQLGVDPAVLRTSQEPVQLGAATDWTSVSAGEHTICAVRSYSLYCIGDNGYEQIRPSSDGEAFSSLMEMSFTNNITGAVSVGATHVCILVRSDAVLYPNEAFCLGDNDYGQIGDETFADTADWGPVSGNREFRSITTGRFFTCGIAAATTTPSSDAGKAFCWGQNQMGQVPRTELGTNVSSPQIISEDLLFLSLQAGDSHICGVVVSALSGTAGSLYCWGSNYNSKSGENGATTTVSLVHRIGSASNWVEVALGDYVSCARTLATRTVASATYCWGDRLNSGNGQASYLNTPTKIPGSGWLTVATGTSTRCGIQGTTLPGKLYCIGSNESGQIGNNSTVTQLTPYNVPIAGDWREVATGYGHTCGISGTGALWCWGRGNVGQLGLGDETSYLTPRQVGSATDWSNIATSDETTCAIKGGTSVFCWGSDASGQVGNGDASSGNVTTPYEVFSASDGLTWRKLSVGWQHVCALDTTGALHCWGDNEGFSFGSGQLGDGTNVDRTSPVDSVRGMRFIDVSAGASSTCGIAVGGGTWCWGADVYGALGSGNSLPDFFFGMEGGTNSAYAGGSAVAVATGLWSGCTVRRGGDLYCWGLSFAGVVPTGTDLASPTPRKVGSGFTKVSLTTTLYGISGGCGIKSDTTLWCWGLTYDNRFQNGWVNEFSAPQLVKVLYRKPVATGGAQFTGRAKKNSVLTADAPDFSGTPIPAVTYQWYRCTKAAGAATSTVPSTCTKITSATRSTYSLKVTEVNKYVRLLITAKNKGGTVTILTASSAKVAN